MMHSGRFTALLLSVEHRTKQLEAWLSDAIKSFRSRNEGYSSRIPRIVLGVKMRDLETKYNGDVLTCMKVLQMDRLAEGAASVEHSTKKRKWLAAQDTDPEGSDELSRAVKNRKSKYATLHLSPPTIASARISAGSPRRMISAGYLSPTKSQLLRTPGTVRQTQSLVQYHLDLNPTFIAKKYITPTATSGALSQCEKWPYCRCSGSALFPFESICNASERTPTPVISDVQSSYLERCTFVSETRRQLPQAEGETCRADALLWEPQRTARRTRRNRTRRE